MMSTVTSSSSSSSGPSSRPNRTVELRQQQQQQHKNTRSNHTWSKPEEIDSYAQQLIEYTAQFHHQQDQSVVITNIDDSLGSYITNCLRTSISELNISPPSAMDVRTIPDYESFCELIQEHCQLTSNIVVHESTFTSYDHNNNNNNSEHDDVDSTNPIAIHVLQKILNVLTTQQVPPDDIILFQHFKQKQTQHHTIIEENSFVPKSLWKDVFAAETEIPTADGDHDDDNNNNDDVKRTPLRPSLLLASSSTDDTDPYKPPQSDTDGLTSPIVSSEREPQPNQEESPQQQQFREEDFLQYEHHDVDEFIRSNVVNMLLQWYVAQDLCYEAAFAATSMANNNVILAQYIISSAFTQMPICKHLLNDGKCYRADCTFNHNIDHHTCVFWMKSRGCSKRDSALDRCRFLHGFSPKLLENIPEHIQIQAAAVNHTGNNNSSITPYRNVRDFYATSVPNNNITAPTSNNHYPSNNNITGSSNVKSFANIASQGYSTQKSFTEPQPQVAQGNIPTTTVAAIQQVVQQLPTMLIPQNLWQAHENRDASAFYISDPLERYYTVSGATTATTSMVSTKKTHNIIDLHYQSIKTFTVVLDTILPDKLALLSPPSDSRSQSPGNHSHNTSGIWIITGTGHHVNTQRTHQKGGSTLESAVLEYLIINYILRSSDDNNSGSLIANRTNKYRIYKGRDRNGKGGAIFIQRKD